MPDAEITVLVVADATVWRDALVHSLQCLPGVTVAACGPLVQAGRLAADTQAPVAVIDAEHGTGDSVDAVRQIHAASPLTRCLAVAPRGSAAARGQLLEAGAPSIVSAEVPLRRLASILLAMHDGQMPLDAPTRRRLRAAWASHQAWARERARVRSLLTPRELEVLTALAEGRTRDDLASALSISTETVRTHIANLLAKLGATSRLEAVAVALRSGVIAPPRPRHGRVAGGRTDHGDGRPGTDGTNGRPRGSAAPARSP